MCCQALPGPPAMPVPSLTSTSSQQTVEACETVHDQIVALLRGGTTPKACRLRLQRDGFHSRHQAKRVVRKAMSKSGLVCHRSIAIQLESTAADLRAGSTSASCCASLMHEKGLSRSQARRIVRKAAVLYGIASAASKRSYAVADTIELLLTGSSRAVCRELLTRDGVFTPKQVRLILHKAVADVNKQELHEDYCRAQARCEAKENDEENNEYEQPKAIRFLDLV